MESQSPTSTSSKPERESHSEQESLCETGGPPAGAPAAPSRRAALVGALLILLVALGLRGAHLASAADTPYPEHLAFLGDAQYYASWSEDIAGGELVGKHSFYMGPLYPYTLGAWSAVSPGDPIDESGERPRYDYGAVFWLQALVDALSCLLIAWIAARLLGPWQGLVAGLVAAGLAPYVYYSGLLMPSTQGLFLNLLVIALSLEAARRGGRGWWLATGLAIGLAALSKAPALLLLPGTWLWLALAFRAESARERALRGAAVALGCLPLVGLATLHNHQADGDRVLITSNAGSNLWIGNGPGASGAHAGVTTEFESAKLDFHRYGHDRPADEPPASEVSRILTARAVDHMAADPGPAAALLWRKLRLFWSAVEIGTDDHLGFFERYSWPLRLPLPGVGVVAPLALAGLLLGLRRWRELWPLYAVVATQAASFTVFLVLSRYRLASVACWIVFALLAGTEGLAAWRGRCWGRLALGAAGLLLGALLVHVPIDGMSEARGRANQLYHLAALEEREGGDALALYGQAAEEVWREGDLSLRQQAVTQLKLGNGHVVERKLRRAAAAYRLGLERCAEMSAEFRYRAPLERDLRGRLEFVERTLGPGR